jgi:hypothetical protein
MLYESTGKQMSVGDLVSIGNAPGRVVCDFEAWECLPGYESWLTKDTLGDGSMFSSGVMIETKAYGCVYHAEANEEIMPVD